jgi:hypothetical protein
MWIPEYSSLQFRCSETKTARNGKNYLVNVPLSFGLTSPALGIRSDEKFWYYTNSINGGPTLQRRLEAKFTPIGYFQRSSIDFAPRRANETSAIMLSLSPIMNVNTKELLSVALPRFKCMAKAPCSRGEEFEAEYTVVIYDAGGEPTTTVHSFALAKWMSMDTPPCLTLDLLRGIKAGDTAQIVVTRDKGLIISDLGVNINDTTLTISVQAKDGPVSPTVFLTSPGIGALIFSKLSLSSSNPDSSFQAGAGRTANVHFSFTLNRDIDAGESVSLGLVGFQSDEKESFATGNAQFSARW